MPARALLHPEQRALYSESLAPPPGYELDAAVATTFSLDFETALSAPVSLALFAAESREEILREPLALLEAVERTADRLVVYCDAGRIHGATREQSRLCGLLERMIVEVGAPLEGAFHPKLWALRYRPIGGSRATQMRLLILSRNLTCDRSWDLLLRLDGEIARRAVAVNAPLVALLRRLPSLALSSISGEAKALTRSVASDLARAAWELPEGFESLDLAVNGLGGEPWAPEPCARIGVVSPFCDDATLQMLAGAARTTAAVVGRSEELAACKAESLARFQHVLVLDEMAGVEDGEEPQEEQLHGLHAKAFIAERGWRTTVTVGSANATQAALGARGRFANVEVLASLTGKTSKVGGVNEMLGEQGMGRLLRPFEANEAEPLTAQQRAAEDRIEAARRLISRARLQLRVEPGRYEDGALGWRTWLSPGAALPLPMLRGADAWPITRGDGHARDALAALSAGEPLDLGLAPLVDVTSFIAFRVTEWAGERTALFSLGLAAEGIPAERHSAVLRAVISNREGFFRYLRLLLSELGDPFGAALAAQTGGGAWARRGAEEAPLLEEMVRALCAGDRRLDAVERMISRLSADPEAEDPVPEDFRQLWESFRRARRMVVDEA